MTKNGFNINRRYLAVFLVSIFIISFALARSVSAMSITVSIPEKYGEVEVGEKVYFETEVKWPENVGRKDLRIEYSVEDKDGKEVAYLKVLKAIETQASFMDSIAISDSTPPGLYKIIAKFSDYGNLYQEVTASFQVDRGGVKSQTFIYIIIGLIFVILLFIINSFYSFIRRSQIQNSPGLMKY